jgi:hypothetical protein
VLPVTPDHERRAQIFERELWRISVSNLDWGEQRVWAALSGSKANANNWRRARAMIQHDRTGELRRHLFVTALERNKHRAVRLRALQDLANSKDPEAYDYAVDIIGNWQKDERREATKLMLKAIADKNVGSREQSTAWIWTLASYTRELHEQYAVQRWPETKRLLGLLVNSSGPAHGRNARRIVQETRKHDLRLAAAILAAAVAHSPEAEEALRGGRTRLARKPAALARELGRNFPKARGRKGRRRRAGEDKKGAGKGRGPRAAKRIKTEANSENGLAQGATAIPAGTVEGGGENGAGAKSDAPKQRSSRRSRGSRNGNASKGERTPRNSGGSQAKSENGASADRSGGRESDKASRDGADRQPNRQPDRSADRSADRDSDSNASDESGGQRRRKPRPSKSQDGNGKAGDGDKADVPPRVPVLGNFEELSRGKD